MSDSEDAENRVQRWSLEDAIGQLGDVALVPAKQRHTNVSDLAKAIASQSYEFGIDPHLLSRLIGIIVKPNHLDQTTVTTIIKNLYPSTKVSADIVARVVCSLGPNKTKPSPATQNLLLRWLVLVYEDLEDPAYLSRLYCVLFDNLDMISLRRSLCHLLSLITRRQHIKPFRIHALLELIQNTGDEEKELLGLLRVFKSYYPDIIVGEAGMSRRRAAYLFKHPDLEWTAHMRAIQDKAATSVDTSNESFRVVHRAGVKRSRIEVVIPVVQTSRLPPGFSSLEELRNVKDFVKKLDKIELPNQIVSALAEPLAQRYLLLVDNKQAFQRLESWLSSFFEDELDNMRANDGAPSEYLEYVLDVLLSFVRYANEIPQAAVDFIRNYLISWDGQDNRKSVLGLMEYIPLSDYDTLSQNYFGPLESAVLDDTVDSKITLLRYYTSVIRRWGNIIRSNAPRAVPPPLPELVSTAELLCLTLLETPRDTTRAPTAERSVGLSVLQFYRELAQLYSFATSNPDIRLTTPTSQTIYLLAFDPSSCNVSLLSSALASYKASFEASIISKSLEDTGSPTKRQPLAMVDQFNGYVMDMCNLLWRNRGLTADDPNAKGCLVSASVTEVLVEYLNQLNDTKPSGSDAGKYRLLLASLFSFGHHVALCGLAAACFRDIETQAEAEGNSLSKRLQRPVTQKALTALEKDGGIKMTWQEFRLKMLDWLDERGSEGIGALMRVTMKTLRRA